jgi:site-specific recombinase XerD
VSSLITACAHELLDRNPVQWVRQSAKRKKIPAVLEIEEVQSLLGALDVRERTMVLLDVVTGLRASELFGLKWTDIDFAKNEISVTRSIVLQVVGPCKTEASQKPVPLDPLLARTLRTWRAHTKYKAASDWVFASPHSGGRKPFWYQSLMRNRIREVARHVGITKRMGWHTFRHTCATLLRASGADIKVVQELLRHASCRVTLDTYTQAVTEQRRAAQNKVAKPGTGFCSKLGPTNSQKHNLSKDPAAFQPRFEAVSRSGDWKSCAFLCLRSFGETNRMSLILYWRPRRDLNPCYRRESKNRSNISEHVKCSPTAPRAGSQTGAHKQ